MAWAPDYVTAAELAQFLRIGDDEDDDELKVFISAASRAVDTTCNRQFGKVNTAEARTYTAEWDRRRLRWVVTIDDVMTEVGLLVEVDSGTIEDYTLEPVNNDKKGKPWTRLVVDAGSPVRPRMAAHNVAVTASWGWTAVPDPVKAATLLQASRFHARRFSPFGIAGSAETGSELRLLHKVDPDVEVTLRPFIRWWGAA